MYCQNHIKKGLPHIKDQKENVNLVRYQNFIKSQQQTYQNFIKSQQQTSFYEHKENEKKTKRRRM